MILLIVNFFTMNYIKKNSSINKVEFNNETPPDMSDDANNYMDKPLEKSSDDSQTSDNSTNDNDNLNEKSNMQLPDKKNIINADNINNTLETTYYIVLAVENFLIAILLIYLLMSKFNKKTLKQTLNTSDRLCIYILLVLIGTVILTYTELYLNKNNFKNNHQPMKMNDNATINVSAKGATEIDNEEQTLNSTYTSTNSDENVILVKNNGILTLTNATVKKSSGNSSNTENSEFYGINSGILVTSSSTASINNTKITTNAKGSNAVFSTGTASKIYINDSTIETTGSSSSRGLDATYGGYIEADNVTITTKGDSCATLATDRGEGTVIAKSSKLETNGSGSPIIYSTGNIQISNTTGKANNSQMVVIEGKNSSTITGSTLYASGKGNRNDVDHAGIMIYQSMSGDANVGTGNFTAIDSTLTILPNSSYYNIAPMFFITNTDAIINLNNTKLVYGSNILISAKGTREWGTSNSNGGNVTVNAKKQELKGNIEIDNISMMTMNLTNSTYEGTINSSNNAKSIILKLDKNSKITLTGNSYITTLDNTDSSNSNINFNGYKLYVNGTALN